MTQSRRNTVLLITLICLVVLTAIVSFKGNSNTSAIVDKTIFRVEDLKSINKIVLESESSNVVLAYEGSHWMVNGRYQADRHLIDLLFATLQQVEPKRSVAGSLEDSVGSALEQTGIKVSLMAEGNTVETFYAGGNLKKTQAYFKKSGDHTSYLMNIPGYRVYAAGIFELDENGWREKRVFNFNWRNFKSLHASFPANAKQDFTVEFINHYFGIKGIAAIDTMKLNNYLDAVSLLQVKQYGAASQKYDSLLKTSPLAVIEVSDVADTQYTLALYKEQSNDQNVLGRIGKDQAVLFIRQDLSGIMKTRDYFIKK